MIELGLIGIGVTVIPMLWAAVLVQSKIIKTKAVTRQKISKTYLALITLLPINYLLFEYFVRHSYGIAYYREAIRAVFLILVCVYLIIVWGNSPLIEKISIHLNKNFNSIYFLLFLFNIAFFAVALFSAKDFIRQDYGSVYFRGHLYQIILFSLPILATYIESAWNINNKSYIRKYINSLYFLFGTLFWLDFKFYKGDGVILDTHSMDLLIIAVLLYIISFIVASVEFFRNEPIQKPGIGSQKLIV